MPGLEADKRPPAGDVPVEPIPRCCDAHDDWTTLAQHVADSFPQAPLSDIARELRMAKDVIDMFNLGDDALEVAELIARHRLMLSSGAIGDAAKLDPQPHNRRGLAARRTAG